MHLGAMTKAHDTIGRYEVVGQLATGGMAEILLARLVGPSGFERPVVIKRILAHLAHSPAMHAMFVDEARILAGLRHANVVHVDTLGEHEGTPYLAMEYLAGESAAGLLRRLVSARRRLPLDLAAYIVAEAAAGLHAAHELRDADGMPRGLVHRDVSPQNVFVTYDGAIKVLDFGIAKATDRIARTETGQLKGKFRYMSPEQTAGAELDRRSDVFSLGAVLYELATSRSLFARKTHLLTMRAICEEPVTAPSRVSPEIPKTFDAVCLRALKRKREDRHPTAAAMRKELLPFITASEGGAEPAERLAAMMRELFADRIAEKGEMLRRVRAGADVPEMPRGDADELVSVPSVAELVETQATATMTSEIAPVRRGSIALAVALVAVGLAAGGSLLVFRSRTTTSTQVPAVSSSAVNKSPEAPAASVVVRITSVPEGARIVIAGKERGVTPAAIELPRSPEEVGIVLEKRGFVPMTQTIVPDSDGKLVVNLVKEPTPIPRRAVPSKKSRPVPATSTPPAFEKFD